MCPKKMVFQVKLDFFVFFAQTKSRARMGQCSFAELCREWLVGIAV